MARTIRNVRNDDTGHTVTVRLKGRVIERTEHPTYGSATRRIAEMEEKYDETVYDIVYRDERTFNREMPDTDE